jgi:hypothetical protein
VSTARLGLRMMKTLATAISIAKAAKPSDQYSACTFSGSIGSITMG